jgi:RNA polymerase sigma factor (sigma-70 family)
VTATTGLLDERDDATLIAAVREGDTEAYGVLFERHLDAARRLARTLARDGDADDLVSEAFAKVLPVLVRGDGPEVAFRPYLLTAIRRLDVDRHRSLTRTRPTDDETVLDAATPAGELPSSLAVAGFESEAAGRAFASLPERWQLVLWHTEVEGQRPADVAPLLGLSPNAVSQLAHRAREGLRQAFVSMHVHDTGEPRSACQTTRANLGAYIRAGLSTREAARVSAHLECCRPCAAIYLELVEVDTDLRGLLAPLLLGGAAAAYLSGVPVAAAPTALASAAGFLRSGAGKALAGTAAAGLAVSAFVLGGAALPGGHHDQPGAVADPPAQTAPARAADGGNAKVGRRHRHPSASHTTTAPTKAPTTTSTAPTGTPTSQAAANQPAQPPTHQPTHQPTHGPTGQPTPAPTPTPTPGPDPTVVDLRVSAAKAGLGPAAVVTVDVAGLGAGHPGTVTLTADQLAASLSLDPRCDLLGINTATCRLSGDGSLRLVGVGGLLSPTTLTITATPGSGLHDPSMGDNTTHVTLG